MPVHPSEEEAPMGITEKVAKDPSSATESTASDHEGHENEHTPHQSGKASAQDLQSKGPQIPMTMNGGCLCPTPHSVSCCSADSYSDMPPQEGSKEDRKARAEELNKE